MLRSGVIAKKVGMTRLFLEDGRQVPVTVLQLDSLQVVAQRTPDRDGYSAVQLGAGAAKPKRVSKAMRGHFAVANVAPKRKIAEFRVAPENLIDVGEEITADHYFEGQFVDVSGHVDRQGLRRSNEAAQLRRTACQPRSFDQPPLPRLYGTVSGSWQGLQGQEDGGPHGRRAGDHAEPASRPDGCRTRSDHGQGRGTRLEGRMGHDQGCGEKADARKRDLSRRAEICWPKKRSALAEEAAAQAAAEEEAARQAAVEAEAAEQAAALKAAEAETPEGRRRRPEGGW